MTEAYTDKSKRLLDQQDIHTEWESNYLNPEVDRFYDLAFAKIADELKAAPGARLLDAGCGYCFHTKRMARGGFRITGVDFSGAAIEVARRTIQDAGLQAQVELRRADLTDLPFADGEFDCVVCWGVIMHVPEMERALSELARVLKPGGRMAIGENNRFSLHVVLWENLLRLVKRALGRSVPQRQNTVRGIEEWKETDTGGLMVRKTNMKFLEGLLEKHGLRQVNRFAGQFTEAYTSVPSRPLKRFICRFNVWYFRSVRAPGPAMGNIVIFEKQQLPERSTLVS